MYRCDHSQRASTNASTVSTANRFRAPFIETSCSMGGYARRYDNGQPSGGRGFVDCVRLSLRGPSSGLRSSACCHAPVRRTAASGGKFSCSRTAARPPGLSNLRGGRAAVASLLPVLSSDAHTFRERGAGPTTTTTTAAFIIALRVSLRTDGAVVPFSRWLPPEWVERLARLDGLLRPDRRAAFGFPVCPTDPPQLNPARVGQLIPRPAFLIQHSEYR